MDPLTASLHDCSHRFIPHVKDNQCAATIQYGGSYYTIVIQKQPVYPSYTPPSVAAAVASMKESASSASASSASAFANQKSVLGKRPHEELEGHTRSYRRLQDYNPHEINLYPELGHNFK